MKNPLSVSIKTAFACGVIAIMTIFITRPSFSQETVKKESQKKMTVKIIRDDSGKTTIIDTTMDLTDSALADSIDQEIEKVIVMGEGGKHARIKCQRMPDGFRYNIKVPCPPDCKMDMDELEGIDLGEGFSGREMEDCAMEGMPPGPPLRMMRPGGNGRTLNDLLGEIPMDRVVNYSIKDHKNGKRIVIDLIDPPMFEAQNQVIIIRDPAQGPHKRNHGERKVKVYVNTDDDGNAKGSPGQPVPPPPPPIVKPDKK